MPTLRVVVVEDDVDSRQVLRLLLEHAGHVVLEAEDAASGVRQIVEANPDVALVDVGLPDVDGYELARRVRATGSRVRLLALTGHGAPEHSRAALEAGFDAHLVKPIEGAALLALLTGHDERRSI
jgi:DNA-binding response OmpR family regulator